MMQRQQNVSTTLNNYNKLWIHCNVNLQITVT